MKKTLVTLVFGIVLGAMGAVTEQRWETARRARLLQEQLAALERESGHRLGEPPHVTNFAICAVTDRDNQVSRWQKEVDQADHAYILDWPAADIVIPWSKSQTPKEAIEAWACAR